MPDTFVSDGRTRQRQEAFRLLKRSIISVESESVLFEEIDEDDLEAAQAVDMPSVGEKRPAEDDAGVAPSRSPRPKKSHQRSRCRRKRPKVQLSYEDYTRYRALITTHLRSRATLDGVPGLKRVRWSTGTSKRTRTRSARRRRTPNC